ncbi:MAG: class I SAM-dependent methyltransferase [Pseudomonadota bacterium]
MLQAYFRNLYNRTMREAYRTATDEIVASIRDGGPVLDCGANNGQLFNRLSAIAPLTPERYFGVEWDAVRAGLGRQRGLQIACADLNRGIPHADDTFSCVFGLSVLEHLLNGCRFLRDSHRVLQPGGKLVILTPNISTYFTAALILAGKMPSSGPHPDSDALIRREEVLKVSHQDLHTDAERDTPVHRHLVVFSYRVLRDYLHMIGYTDVRGYGFGLYPFPNFMQPVLEKIDPWHCHQMVFIARKPGAA